MWPVVRLASDFLRRWPTLAQLQAARPATLRAFYYGHRCRRPDLVNQRLQQIQAAHHPDAEHENGRTKIGGHGGRHDEDA